VCMSEREREREALGWAGVVACCVAAVRFRQEARPGQARRDLESWRMDGGGEHE
jgi:hypothetical protein